MENKTPTSLYITGCIAAMLIGTGACFKLMHWPFSGPLTIIGSLTFIFLYFPLWFMHRIKGGNKLLTVFYSFIFLLTFLTYFLKTMHWPMAGLFLNLWIMSSMGIVLPVSVILILRSKGKSLFDFNLIVLYFLFGSMIIGGIGSSSSRMIGLANSFSKKSQSINTSTKKLSVKNKQLYAAFEMLQDKDKIEQYKNAMILRAMTDSMDTYLRNFRNYVISMSENGPLTDTDSINQSELYNLLSYEVITTIVWGNDDYEPITGRYTGMELKGKLEFYRESVISLVDSENKELIKNAININTDTEKDENGEAQHWVASTFRFINEPTFLSVISSLRYEIKNCESQVLTDLLSSTKQNSDNLSLKVAELGAKLENTRKEQEIKELKTQTEMARLNMDNKNRELDAQSQTITAFIVGLFLCMVMVFFIIRSNILRKQANRELAKQKHLVEEKQKEILDSIKYAKRIQQAHLPTDKYLRDKLKTKD
jgi:hypothetical protein